MKREECEAKILKKLKEIKTIAKKYDKSEEFYISMTIYDDRVRANNAYWETDTPINVTEHNDGMVMQFDN